MKQLPHLSAALAVALVVGACALESPTDSAGDAPATIGIQPSLIPSPSDGSALPINRIRTRATRVPGDLVVGESTDDVDPTADSWTIELALNSAGEVTVVVYVYLINVTADGTETVQFSGKTDPIVVGEGEAITPDVPLVRGPVENLAVTSVSITSAPQGIVEGATATLTATAATTDGSQPAIFWTSLDEVIVSMDGAVATAGAAGTTRVIASAGAFADTVTIRVIPADSDPPVVVTTDPQADATGVATSITLRVTFDEDVDPASVTTATFELDDGDSESVGGSVSTDGSDIFFAPAVTLDQLETYTARVGSITDLAGNPMRTPFSWSFTTATTPADSFNPLFGTLVAIAFDEATGNLIIHDDFSDLLRTFSQAGQEIGPSIQRPGVSSNDIDLDFLTSPATMGQTQLPANTLLVMNGETAPGELFAIDKTNGSVLASLPLQSTGNPVGGAYHPERNSFYSIAWNVTGGTVTETNLATGAVVQTFPVQPTGSPTWSMFYGDLEVDPVSLNLLLVSSVQNSVRVLTPFGAFIEDIDLGPLGVTSMSGIAYDSQTSTAWITSTNGNVYRVVLN